MLSGAPSGIPQHCPTKKIRVGISMDASEAAGALDVKIASTSDQLALNTESVPAPAVFDTSSVDLQPKLRRHASQGAETPA